MKEKITIFLDNLIALDYVLFGSTFLFFILFVILGILVRRRALLATFFIFLAFMILLIVPTYGYIKMHEYLFKNSIVITTQKQLKFSDAIVLKGAITNESKKDFHSCKITASVYAVTSNKLKNYLKKLKPFKKMSILEEDIGVAQTRTFKMIIEPFTYSKEYNISIGADCR